LFYIFSDTHDNDKKWMMNSRKKWKKTTKKMKDDLKKNEWKTTSKKEKRRQPQAQLNKSTLIGCDIIVN
jgi:hypothetical protein